MNAIAPPIWLNVGDALALAALETENAALKTQQAEILQRLAALEAK